MTSVWEVKAMKKMSDNALKNAGNKIGKKLVYEARKRVAVNAFNTGMLQDSIHYDFTYNSNELLVKIGSNLNYAPFVEFGTGIYGGTDAKYGGYASGPGRQTGWAWYDPSGKYRTENNLAPEKIVSYGSKGNAGEPGWVWTRGMKPKPYLYPAILENKWEIMKIVGKEIQKELK